MTDRDTAVLDLTRHLAKRETLNDPILKTIWTQKELQDELNTATNRLARACVEYSTAYREYLAAKARLEINEDLNDRESERRSHLRKDQRMHIHVQRSTHRSAPNI